MANPVLTFGRKIKSLLVERQKQREEKLKKRKLVIGAGGLVHDASWFCTEIHTLDVTKKENWEALFEKGKIINVFAEHVWEHLTPEQAEIGNKNIFEYLKKNGRFRVAVPDGFHPDPAYINHVKVDGIGPGADDHKILYTYKTLKASLEKVGFKIELQEYWDENGKFHYTDWNLADGKVLRSRRFDKRNEGGELKYTSLIIDAIKP